jgi:hypothetical protein
LANTQARLQQLYGANHRFEIGNARDGGFAVTLAIPLRFANHPNEDHQPAREK